MSEYYYVYILTNKSNTIYYVGVTNNLIRRVWEHTEKVVAGFTEKYNIYKLVWYEVHEDINEAIIKEKQLKSGSRQKKINLVVKKNELWKDLYEEIIQ